MMKDKEKTKKKLIEQYTDITDYKKTEGSEREYISEMKFLADSAMDFVEFPLEKDIFKYVGEKVQKIIGDAVIYVNEFDKEKDGFVVRYLGGYGKKFKKVLSIVGKDPAKMVYKIVGLEISGQKSKVSVKEGKAILLSCKLIKWPGGFAEMSSRYISKSTSQIVKKLFNLNEAYMIGLSRKGEILGEVVIILRGQNKIKNPDFVETFIKQAAIALQRKNAEEQVKESFKKLQKTMKDSIYTLSRVIEARDPYTAGHQRKVSKLAVALAKDMGLPQDRIEGIKITALIHDIGKINVPVEILSKPGKLSEMEFGLIKNHSQKGYEILKTIDFPWPVAEIVLQHHEKMNGSGYPRGLKGDEILLEAKIICIADVVEAISSHRPYRPALGIDAALNEINKNKGILYDTELVDTCLKLFKEKGFKF